MNRMLLEGWEYPVAWGGEWCVLAISRRKRALESRLCRAGLGRRLVRRS